MFWVYWNGFFLLFSLVFAVIMFVVHSYGFMLFHLLSALLFAILFDYFYYKVLDKEDELDLE
jgi:Flp pilus assembly protein TadB